MTLEESAPIIDIHAVRGFFTSDRRIGLRLEGSPQEIFLGVLSAEALGDLERLMNTYKQFLAEAADNCPALL